MTRQTNAVNQTGLERFTVSLISSSAAFTTIQGAVDAATAAGGGSVFIDIGTYTEVVTITSNVSLVCLNSSSGASGTNNVRINGGVTYDTTAQSIEAEISGITFDGAAGIPGLRVTGVNSALMVAQNCNFTGSTDTCIELSAPALIKLSLCNINANGLGVATFNITNGQIFAYNCFVNGNDTRSTINSSPGNNALFYFSCLVFDAYDIIQGQVICYGCLVGTISTLSFAIVQINGAAGFPGSLIIQDTSSTGYIIDGNGPGTSGVAFFFSFAQAPNVPTPISFDPDLTVVALNELPYGQGGVTATAIRGSVAFNSSTFSVSSTGFVSLVSSPAAWVDTVASTTIVPGTGYSVSAGVVVLTLPATAAFGTRFSVALSGGTSWQVAQNGGQSVRFGTQSTTVGAGGSLMSNAQGDVITCVCDVADTHWFVESSIGNIIVV